MAAPHAALNGLSDGPDSTADLPAWTACSSCVAIGSGRLRAR